MVEIHPPPPPSTPREAPWREIEEIIDGQKTLIERINALIDAISGIVIPPIPPPEGPPTDLIVLLRDLNVSGMALDMRSFLIVLYRLGRAREVRIYDYSEVDAAGTGTFTYTIPNDFVYIPHIEEIELGLQRIITRRDYEGGNIIYTEEYATDRIVEWTMTPLARVVTGSFGISFENIGTTDTWIKSRFLGTLMRESDFGAWRRLVRDISGKYMAFMT